MVEQRRGILRTLEAPEDHAALRSARGNQAGDDVVRHVGARLEVHAAACGSRTRDGERAEGGTGATAAAEEEALGQPLERDELPACCGVSGCADRAGPSVASRATLVA